MRVFGVVVRHDFTPVAKEVAERYRALEPDYEVRSDGPLLLVLEPRSPAVTLTTGSISFCGDTDLYEIDGRSLSEERDLPGLLWSLASDPDRTLMRLNGEFAFVLADQRDRRIVLARDRLGICPLYWMRVGEDLVCGSVPSLVAHHPAYRFDLDKYGVVAGILEADGERTRTAWRGIESLPSGSRIVIRDGTIVSRRPYWRLRTGNVPMTPEDAREGFREALVRAIRRRHRSGVTGAFLSGGLDSSSVVCAATESGLDLVTYTLRFPGDELADEGRFVEAVVRKYGLENVPIEVDAETCMPWTADANTGSPEVFYYPNLQMLEPLYEAAAGRGTKLLLDGLGGDHLLYGTIAPLDLIMARLRSGDLRDAIRIARSWSSIEEIGPVKGVMRLLLRRVAPPPVRFLWAKWKEQFPARHVPLRLAMTTAIARDLYPWKRPALTNQAKRSTAETMRSRWHFERWFEQNRLLAHCHGIDQRSPFADVDLVEFILSVPPAILFDRDTPRALQREAMRGILPEEVRGRSGKGEFDRLISGVLRNRLIPDGRCFLRDHGIEASSWIAREANLEEWIGKIENGPPGWETTLYLEVLNYERWLAHARSARVFCAGVPKGSARMRRADGGDAHPG